MSYDSENEHFLKEFFYNYCVHGKLISARQALTYTNCWLNKIKYNCGYSDDVEYSIKNCTPDLLKNIKTKEYLWENIDTIVDNVRKTMMGIKFDNLKI